MTATKNQEYDRNTEADSESTSSLTTESTDSENSASKSSLDYQLSNCGVAADRDPVDSTSGRFRKQHGNDAEVEVVDPSGSKIDPLLNLKDVLATDTNRLILKWEPWADDDGSCCNGGRITVGADTHLPLGERGSFSLEIPPQQQASPTRTTTSPSKELLFRLVSKIVRLSPFIRQLDLEGFGSSTSSPKDRRRRQTKHKSATTMVTLDIEDVFEAFAREPSSSWRKGGLGVLRTWNCDMNSYHGNHCFDLEEHEYPEGLEEVYIHDPKANILSSSIFKIATRARKLNRFYVFRGYNNNYDDEEDDGNDNDSDDDANDAAGGRVENRSRLQQFNGSWLTQSAIDAICDLFASTNKLLEMNQLPHRELLQLPCPEFCRILEATRISRTAGTTVTTTTTPRYLMTAAEEAPSQTQTAVPPSFVILATRSEALRYSLLRKRSLEILRDPPKGGLFSLVLETCGKRNSIQHCIKQWIPVNRNDLLFGMLKDSLEGILNASTRSEQHLKMRMLLKFRSR